jgi:hypothetical protein
MNLEGCENFETTGRSCLRTEEVGIAVQYMI